MSSFALNLDIISEIHAIESTYTSTVNPKGIQIVASVLLEYEAVLISNRIPTFQYNIKCRTSGPVDL
jgi:predicted peptidase